MHILPSLTLFAKYGQFCLNGNAKLENSKVHKPVHKSKGDVTVTLNLHAENVQTGDIAAQPTWTQQNSNFQLNNL